MPTAGDGATDHLDEETDMPGEIRVESDFVLGRTDDRAEYVLPIATGKSGTSN